MKYSEFLQQAVTSELVYAALELDQAEEEWDDPNYSFHHEACENFEIAKKEFREAVALYRRVVHGESEPASR